MDQHELLKEYVRMLVNGDTASLIVKGGGGIGKSYTVLEELREMGLKEGINYLYISGYTTPLKLFNTMVKTVTLEAPKLLIFDDIDALITNKMSVALLKASLWEVRGKRVVTYESSSSKVDASSMDFEGKVLIILNDLKQENTFGKPLLDRCTVFDMALTPKELIQYVGDILPNIKSTLPMKTRQKIWNEIKIFSDNPRFSLRSLVRAFEFYHHDNKKWKTLFINSLKLDSQQKIYYEIITDNGVRNKAERFAERTGQNKRTYYKVKKRMPDCPDF